MIVFACITVCKLILACNVCKVESAIKEEVVPTKCTNGTYYSRDYRMCVPCSTCDIYSTMFSMCTPTSDTVCIKCADTSSQKDLDNHPACRQCPPCKAGEYMETKCTDNTTTVCRPCPVGSFTKLASYQTHCFPCTSCVNRVMIRDCNTSLDTECGSCKKGYFRDPSRSRCYRCVSCMPGQTVTEECKNGRPGKLCSTYLFSRVDYVDIPVKDEIDTSASSHASTTATAAVNQSTSASSEEASMETTNLSLLDVTIFLAVIISIFMLSIMIALLKRRLTSQRKRMGIIDDYDSNDGANLYLDNFGHINDLADCESLTESRLSDELGGQNKSVNQGYVSNTNELAPSRDGSSGHHLSVSYLKSLKSEDKLVKDPTQVRMNLFLHNPTLYRNQVNYPTQECRKNSRHA